MSVRMTNNLLWEWANFPGLGGGTLRLYSGEPPNFPVTYDDWEYHDDTPPQPGWYATLYGWDIEEGSFPKATEWLGDRWDGSLPFFAWQGPFADEEAAERWADEHDPER